MSKTTLQPVSCNVVSLITHLLKCKILAAEIVLYIHLYSLIYMAAEIRKTATTTT